MVPDARVFSSIKNEQKYPWLYNSVIHQGYLCKFCELFCGHSSSSQEWPNDPAKDLESWFSKARKILNFQYINWPTEEDIELWLNHWKNICFYPFILYLWLPIFSIWPLKFEFGHQIFEACHAKYHYYFHYYTDHADLK